MSTSALRGIKQKHQDCDLTYSTWAQCGDLVALNPHIDQLRQPGRFMCSDFDVMVDFRHEAEPPRFTGDDNPLAYWGYVHAMQCRDAGLLDPMDSYKPDLYIGPGDMVRKEGGMLCVVNVWSHNGIDWRLWPVDKWERLIVALKKMGYTVAQVGGKGDPKIDGVQIQLCGKTSLAQSISLVAAADLVVGIDSFVCHVAHSKIHVRDVEAGTIEMLANSTPCVLLAGPIPWRCVVPEDAKCVPVSAFPDCVGPCDHSFATKELPICEHGNSCMKELPVDAVLAGVEELKEG